MISLIFEFIDVAESLIWEDFQLKSERRDLNPRPLLPQCELNKATPFNSHWFNGCQ